MPWELGVPGAAEAPPVPPPLELSLLFWPVESCERLGTTIALMSQGFSTAARGEHNVLSLHYSTLFFLSGSPHTPTPYLPRP